MRNFLAYFKKEFSGYDEVINLPMQVYRTFQYIQYREELARKKEREAKAKAEAARKADEANERKRQEMKRRMGVKQLTIEDMKERAGYKFENSTPNQKPSKEQQQEMIDQSSATMAQALYDALEDEMD